MYNCVVLYIWFLLIGLYCTRPIYYVVGVVMMFKFVLVQVGLQACLMHGAFLAVVSSNPIKGCVLEQDTLRSVLSWSQEWKRAGLHIRTKIN